MGGLKVTCVLKTFTFTTSKAQKKAAIKNRSEQEGFLSFDNFINKT